MGRRAQPRPSSLGPPPSWLLFRLLEISEAADLAFPEDAARYHLPQPPKSGDAPPSEPDPAPEEPAA